MHGKAIGTLSIHYKVFLAKVELRKQGSPPRTQKNPRPKTAFPRTDSLEAKDRNTQGQRHRHKCSLKNKVFKNVSKTRSSKFFFRRFQNKKKRSSKQFVRRSPKEEKKRSLQILCKISGVFQQNFKGSKNNPVLKLRTGQFSRT